MSVLESQVVSLWEKAYKNNVNNRFLTKLEAFNMIANELNIDYGSIIKILKNKYNIQYINKIS